MLVIDKIMFRHLSCRCSCQKLWSCINISCIALMWEFKMSHTHTLWKVLCRNKLLMIHSWRGPSDLIFMNHWCVRWSTVLRVTFLTRVTLQFFFLLLNWIILHLLFLILWESHHSHFPNKLLIYLEEWVEGRKRKYCYLLTGKLP